jgi:hypothetical protein
LIASVRAPPLPRFFGVERWHIAMATLAATDRGKHAEAFVF